MDENQHSAEEPVCTLWSRMLQGVLGAFLLAGTALVAHYYAPQPHDDLKNQVSELNHQVQQLRQEQAMPSLVLNRYRNSICYIFGVYQVGFGGMRPSLRVRVSGTGFVVAPGLLATNRHVAEPWYEDAEAGALIKRGATPQLERLLAFFPGLPSGINVAPVVLSAHGDLAILRVEDSAAVGRLAPLPLTTTQSNPGDLVTVIGYPMGVLGMVAKSPTSVYDRLAYRHDDMGAATELAALSLIRPSATCGHLGDVVAEKLIYDAPTAHGGSGGPVFNSRGQVIGVNSAYIDGFSGGTLGVSVDALRPLIDAAQRRSQQLSATQNDVN